MFRSVIHQQRRTFAAAAGAPKGKQVPIVPEILAAAGLGTIIAGGWYMWARGQYKKVDQFYEKLDASKTK
eukprot:snap_masked-scaffold_12-processed-gene-5.49-mRNA-1 protein AED:1.00 eAED:1.00 QI:0/-1/0/0/-1/1/1/0/69